MTRFPRLTLLLTVVGCLVFAIGCQGSGDAEVSAPSRHEAQSAGPPAPSWLVVDARELARVCGDADPRTVLWGERSGGGAGAAAGSTGSSGSGVSSGKRVILALHGEFDTVTFSHPYGYTPPPIVPWVVITYDAVTHEETGRTLGFDDRPPIPINGLWPLALD